jgi:hypothetical protein
MRLKPYKVRKRLKPRADRSEKYLEIIQELLQNMMLPKLEDNYLKDLLNTSRKSN